MSSPSNTSAKWTYLELMIIDGERRLRPTHIWGQGIRFNIAPDIQSEHLTVVTQNGDRLTKGTVRVLPHERDSCEIPIEIIHPAENQVGVVKEELSALFRPGQPVS